MWEGMYCRVDSIFNVMIIDNTINTNALVTNAYKNTYKGIHDDLQVCH